MTVAVHLLLAVLCCLGHMALMVALINRIDAFQVPRRMLRCLSLLHHVLLLIYPAILTVFVIKAVRDPSLRLFWDSLPGAFRWYSYLCAMLSALLPMRILQNLLRRPPAVLLSQSARRVDVAKELGYRPVARQKYHALTLIPGNEVLSLEFSEKHLRLPRLPVEWDGLRVLHLSDTHFIGTIERAWFEYVCRLGREARPDLVVFTGDLLDRPELAEWLPDTLGSLTAPLGCWFVLGNHDWYAGDPDSTRTALTRLGWEDARKRVQTLPHQGRPLVIAGTERPWMGDDPDLSNIPDEAFRLLLSHSPDQIAWARAHGIDLMLAGHTHGGQVRLPLLGPVYCPSLYGPRFCEGVFFESPTTLHVSRGLSGETPLRVNCFPELTLLVLRAGREAAQ